MFEVMYCNYVIKFSCLINYFTTQNKRENAEMC